MIWTIIRHRRALRRRPELARAYRAERAELRAARAHLRAEPGDLPRDVLKDMDRDLTHGARDARRELARALRDGGRYHAIDDRPAASYYAQAILEVNADLAAMGEPPLEPGPARATYLLATGDVLDAVAA